VPSGCGSSVPKLQTSADSWQPEGASLESCCSASSTHGTARTEAQRLGLLASLATSNIKRNFGSSCPVAAAALLRNCERLQIAGSQKGLAWKAVSQPHLPIGTARTEVERLGLLACLATSNFKRSLGMGWCLQDPFLVLMRKCECLQIAGS